MATEIKLPDLGENIEAGTVVNVLVKPGDAIEEGQPILEIETGKAAVEVPSPARGKVSEIKVNAGDEVKVGAVVLLLDGDGAPAAPEAKPKEPPATKEAEKSATRAEAKPEQEARPVAEKPAPAAEIREPAPAAKADAPAPPAEEEEEEESGDRKLVPAAPSVRRFAREIGVDIGAVKGSGPGGRISVEDVKAHAKESREKPAARAATAPAAVPLPDFAKWGTIEREKITGIRKATAEHMARAWASIPHVTNYDRADVTDLEKWRKAGGPRVEKAGGKLTVTAIAVKLVAAALREFPKFASSLDIASGEIVYKRYVNVGVAVDTERGLVVPVIRGADRKSLVELAVELGQVAEKARSGKLSLDEMQGGVFTITNLGGLGATDFAPIINWPEVAILALSRSAMQPVWNGSEFAPRLILPLGLSYDHRVIDGADAARFLRWLAEAFENPLLHV